MLTEQAIDAINGPQKGPALGCYHKKPSNNNNNNHGKPQQHNNNNNNQHRGGFGQNGGRNFGYTPKPGSGLLGGRRVLLDRMLQQREQRGPSGQQRQSGGVDQKNEDDRDAGRASAPQAGRQEPRWQDLRPRDPGHFPSASAPQAGRQEP